jgi:hypothetical protein
MGMINDPAFLLTLPRKAQRRLPEKHQLKTVDRVTGVVKKKTARFVLCLCGWESEPLSPEETGKGGVTRVMHQHLLEEAAKLS